MPLAWASVAGLFDVLLNGILAAVKHHGAEAALDCRQRFLIGAVVHVRADRHGDLEEVHEIAYHVRDGPVAAHVLGRAAGHAQDDGAFHFLGGQQERADGFHIVQVEVAHGVMALLGQGQHFFGVYVRHTV